MIRTVYETGEGSSGRLDPSSDGDLAESSIFPRIVVLTQDHQCQLNRYQSGYLDSHPNPPTSPPQPRPLSFDGDEAREVRIRYQLSAGESPCQRGPAVYEGSGSSAWILTRISHRWSTTSPQSSALAVFRSVGLLDVLHEYDCGGLGRKPCQDGPCGASLRQAMRNAGSLPGVALAHHYATEEGVQQSIFSFSAVRLPAS